MISEKRLQIFSKIFLILSISSFILFVGSALLIFSNLPSYQMLLDSFGFSNFFQIYNPSFQFGTASVVLFTIWLTLERMKQTKGQIDLTQDDVNLNNYYKHRDEFVSFISKKSVFITLEQQRNFDIATLLYPVYSYFFNQSYKDFKPSLNSKARKEIDCLIEKVKVSTLNKPDHDLSLVAVDELKELAVLINMTVDSIFIFYSKIDFLVFNDKGKFIEQSDIQEMEERFILITTIHWSVSLYEDILAFDGIAQQRQGAIAMNYSKYRFNI